MAWTRSSKEQPVCIQNEPANVCFLQNQFQSWCVSTFRKPKSGRFCAEGIDVHVSPDQNLCTGVLERLLLKQGKQTMRSCGGDDFKPAIFPQFAKSGEQIAFTFVDKKTSALRKQT